MLIVILLAFAFWYGGDAPSLRGWNPEENDSVVVEQSNEEEQSTTSVETSLTKAKEEIEIPFVEEQATIVSNGELTCTMSIRCDTILNNIEWLDSEKVEIIPKDGVMFAEKTVVFYEGESVFDVLLREMKSNKIHMEFVNVPIYNSAYIEAIANLYEFDCGELSGWMYKVNGWFPNYGCSQYQLKAGDKIEWVYTCDLGADVGGQYTTQ
ncbi:MAG: DUF4430 domain-containing protein [Clostridia bacterium]|nr:DUF4430 domain-containing protein [Clostridia bacterium]